ncbi:helix-turn-helix transcriptional regulator [Stackebrandtia endophytica]|uniref:helix-turn-helix domain-containing protein n=1 Tax=Stackebrandtia endophytica TaxID=1496996 RepID=UPI00114ECECA|nr:helix-turn-helix transcriptional regulator [Stackebrandtia endophytica]
MTTPYRSTHRRRQQKRAAGFGSRSADDDASYRISLLTPQEQCIAQLASQGLTNPEIGLRLSISSSTIRYHLSKVFQKLAISSRRQLLHSQLFADGVDTANIAPRRQRHRR